MNELVRELAAALRIHHEWCTQHQPCYSEHGDDAVAYRSTAALLARAADAAVVPAGWKLVPLEPTEEQIGVGYFGRGTATADARERLYRAMVEAAPTPPDRVASAVAHPS